jgi:hypothetical protein
VPTGKYAKIINQLPRLIGDDPKFQDKVTAVQHEMMTSDPQHEPNDAVVEQLIEHIERDIMTINNLLLKTPNGRQHGYVLARTYRLMRKMKEVFETQEKETNILIESVKDLCVTQFEMEGTSLMRLDTGESVAVQYEPYAKVKDRDALRAWAMQSGLERSLMLPWQTLNALTKERLLKGEPEPAGVEAYASTKLVLRKK